MRIDKKSSQRTDKKAASRGHKQGVVGYSKKSALLEDAITQMNAGKYGRSSAALKELLALDPLNMEARRLFATLHLRLGSLIPARQAFESLVNEAFERQDYWLAESLLREYLAAGPRCVPFLEKLGTIYHDKGDALAAVTEYGKAIDILIEDPDPDQPQLASQLYAKVRELAPASPVAFRLAAFFDAQSGELVARPKPAQPESGDSATASTEVSFTDETGLVSDSATSSDQGTGHPAAIADPFTGSPVGGAVSDYPRESSWSEESAVDVGDPNLAASGSVHSQTGPTSIESPAEQPAEERLTMGPSTETSEVRHGEFRFANAAPSPSETQSPGETKLPNTDPFSAPMPWDRVEDSAVSIPEREIETLPEHAPMAGTAPATVRPIAEPSASADGMAARSPGDVAPGTGGDSTSSISEQASSDVASEGPKKEGFSWESVFARAWNFGGAPSSLDQKEDTPNVEIEAAKQPEPAAVPPAVHDQGPEQSDLSLRAGGELGSPPPSEPAAAPMPWDQVQDATIKIIPPTEVEQPVLATAVEEPSVLLVTQDSSPSDLLTSSPDPAQPGPSPTSARLDFEPMPEAPTPVNVTAQTSSLGAGTAISDEPASGTQRSVSTLSGSPSVLPSEQPIESTEQPVDHLSSLPAAEPVLEAPSHQDGHPATSSGEPEPVAFTQGQPPLPEQPVHWNTGEVAVQTHRPSPKKRKRSPVSEQEPAEDSSPVDEQAQAQPVPAPHQEPSIVEPVLQSDVPVQESESWVSASGSIRFVDPAVSAVERPSAQAPTWENPSPGQPVAAAVSAVDVLFDSTQRTGREQAQKRVSPKQTVWLRAALNRIRISAIVFLRSCFSTTRAIVTTVAALAVLSAVMLVLVIGAVGMAWLAMEEKPAPAFQALTTFPQRHLADAKANGYLLLLGFDAPSSVDPVQTGSERKSDAKDAEMTAGCISAQGSGGETRSADATKSWFGASDPAAQFRRDHELLKALTSQNEPAIGRYRQWLKMRFEDWGYGQSVSPPCVAILSAHRLFVADGFTQSQLEPGVDRLEVDMEAWRATLSQARTLPIKTMALQAINDDIAVASGLLVRPESDSVAPDRLAKMLRPLDQMELSLRWPMQSQFVVATKTLEARLKADRAGPMPLHVRVASALPLPKQRRFNDYAKYYEASYKAAGEGRFGSLPKRMNYVRSPANSVVDIVRNPLENLIGLEPLADWEFYSGLVVDTDARLRLASLQVALRRAPAGANLMAQIAKAGQSFYDPYTGYPMLVNPSKGVLYSVGHDGRDQDGHPQVDVIVAIPAGVGLTTKTLPGSPAGSR